MTDKEEIAQLKEKAQHLEENLNMLKLYFRDYDILEHYLAWIKAKAHKKKIPNKLKIKN